MGDISELDVVPTLTALNLGSDYSYLITKSGSTYYAKNNEGSIFNSNSDFGALFNACGSALNGVIGIIALQSNIQFLTSSSCILKNNMYINGNGAEVKLADGANCDIFVSENFASLTGTNSQSGVQGVILEDFTIDGNYTNNASAGYGIRYYGWNWKLKNISIQNCRNDGIYSEWYNGPNIPSPFSMESYYINLKVHHCQGVNIRDRGPHDSQWTNVICWAGVNGNVVCETLAATYSSGVMMIGCHFWSSNNDTVNFLIDGAQVFGAGIEAEGTHGTNGIGIKVTNSGKLKATGLKCFANVIGMTLNSSGNEVEGSFYSNSSKGMIIAANDNIITGVFRANTDIGLEVGASGSTQVNRNMIIGDWDDNANHIKWWDATSYDNFVMGHIETNTGEEAMDSAGVNPNLSLNCILIDSKGAGTNYTMATPLNYANGAQLASSNILTETLTINKTNAAAISELLQQWGVDDDATSYLKLENLSASNAIFIARFNALSNLASSSTSSAIEIRGQLRASSDIGTTNPVIILDARLHTSTGAVTTRALVTIRNNATEVYSFFPTAMVFADAKNITVGTSTGTKIGTATNQKLGLFGVIPVVQPGAISSPSADTASLKTAVDAIRAALTAIGVTA